jgi:hypothetical protein
VQLSPDVLRAVDDGTMEIVEVEENGDQYGVDQGDAAPPPIIASRRKKLAQEILAKRREGRAVFDKNKKPRKPKPSTNGNGKR